MKAALDAVGIAGKAITVSSVAAKQAAGLAKALASATVEKAVATAGAIQHGAGRAKDVLVGGGATAAKGSLAVAAALTAEGYNKIKQRFSDKDAALSPILSCANVTKEPGAVRAERIQKRNQLIHNAQNDPELAPIARQLEKDMGNVEMARLSAAAYAAYDPKDASGVPSPWVAIPRPGEPLTDTDREELKKMGFPNPDLLVDAKAAVFKVPDGFPFEPKTVVAFRGTTGSAEDILTDHDQALGDPENPQYQAAIMLGEAMALMSPVPAATGHSLGGGKAQAAVVGSGGAVHGIMFNSAGLHPKSVGMSPDEMLEYAAQCNQQRTEGGWNVGGGDPLTGTQRSLMAQAQAYGLAGNVGQVARGLGFDDEQRQAADTAEGVGGAMMQRLATITPAQAKQNFDDYGWYIPPTLGQAASEGVVAKNADGTDAGLAAQHSIVTMINGYEHRKLVAIRNLVEGTGSKEPMQALIGAVK